MPDDRTLDSHQLAETLSGVFPGLRSDLQQDADLPTLQMITFKVFTQRAIDSGDLSTVRQCFSMLTSYAAEATLRLFKAVSCPIPRKARFPGNAWPGRVRVAS
jgi:hypothetical protein